MRPGAGRSCHGDAMGGSNADWPTPWEGRADNWPDPPERWVPGRAGRGVIMCVRVRVWSPSEIIDWGTAEDAELADRLLYAEPCGKVCIRQHIRVWTEPGRVHVAPSVHNPRPPSLAAECYPSRRNGHPTLSTSPACWPQPTVLNLPLVAALRSR